jgi:Arc/MetJ-type ribon-helix-helix transcriptional regulator
VKATVITKRTIPTEHTQRIAAQPTESGYADKFVIQNVVQFEAMARTVQARLDERAEDDLAVLRNEGHNDSDAIRVALREAAERRRRRSALRAEAQAAADDPEDLAETRRVREEMDALSAAWPEA